MKKILHAVSIMNRAGQETFIMNMFREIDRSRFSFDFIVSLDGKGDFDEEIYQLGGKIFKLKTSDNPKPHIETFLRTYRLYDFLRKHKEYSIVHFHNHHAYSALLQVIAAKAAGVKSVIVHSHNSSAPNPGISKLFRPFLNSLKIHRLACSDLASKWLFGRKSIDCQVVKNGIDPTIFQYNEADRLKIRKELSLEDKPVILHVGRFNFQKNHKFLLEIFSELLGHLPNAHLLLVGQGELENEIRNKIVDMGIQDHVSVLGIRSDIPALLSASDLFLFPSLFEGLSVMLVETQVNGLPILTTDNLAQETIYSPNLFTMALVQSSEEWADKAEYLIRNSHRIDGAQLATDAGFNMKMVAKDMSDYYSSL